MTQPDFLTITHSKDFTLFISASLDDFNDFRHYFQDVERSRNVIKQELYLVENQKKSVFRVIIPIVERSRDDHSILPVIVRSRNDHSHMSFPLTKPINPSTP